MLARAAAAGVGEMVTIGTAARRNRDASVALAEAHAERLVHASASIRTMPPRRRCRRRRRSRPWPATRRSSASARSGLDYFYDKAPRDVQQASFRAHIRAARLAGLPLAIHARDADDDIAAILREEREAAALRLPAALLQLRPARWRRPRSAMGGYVSFSGILTFPKSHELRAIARDLPADRLLVETDAPYLAPVPFRGKRNEPAWIATPPGCWPRCGACHPRPWPR